MDILSYHQRSKHRPDAYARGPESIDWDAQPDPFRTFEAPDDAGRSADCDPGQPDGEPPEDGAGAPPGTPPGEEQELGWGSGAGGARRELRTEL